MHAYRSTGKEGHDTNENENETLFHFRDFFRELDFAEGTQRLGDEIFGFCFAFREFVLGVDDFRKCRTLARQSLETPANDPPLKCCPMSALHCIRCNGCIG